MKPGDLAVDFAYHRRGHAVIDDRVEPDLGQCVAQLGRGAVERPSLAHEVGPEIDDWDRVNIWHV